MTANRKLESAIVKKWPRCVVTPWPFYVCILLSESEIACVGSFVVDGDVGVDVLAAYAAV